MALCNLPVRECRGPPRDVDGAIAVLRQALAAGSIISIPATSTAHVTNQIIKRALHPYPDDLVIVTKVGARRGEDSPGFMRFRVKS